MNPTELSTSATYYVESSKFSSEEREFRRIFEIISFVISVEMSSWSTKALRRIWFLEVLVEVAEKE